MNIRSIKVLQTHFAPKTQDLDGTMWASTPVLYLVNISLSLRIRGSKDVGLFFLRLGEKLFGDETMWLTEIQESGVELPQIALGRVFPHRLLWGNTFFPRGRCCTKHRGCQSCCNQYNSNLNYPALCLLEIQSQTHQRQRFHYLIRKALL